MGFPETARLVPEERFESLLMSRIMLRKPAMCREVDHQRIGWAIHPARSESLTQRLREHFLAG